MAAGWGELSLLAQEITPPRLTSRYARCFADPPPPGEGEARKRRAPAQVLLETQTTDQRPGRSSRPATPAATLRPVCAWPLTGCNEMVLPEPPNSALAPAPTPTVALAAPPP